MGREQKLGATLSGLIEEKCKLLEKFSLIQKEYEGYEVALRSKLLEKFSLIQKEYEGDEVAMRRRQQKHEVWRQPVKS